MISEIEHSTILERCRTLPPAKGYYIVSDFIENIFITVLDFMLNGIVVQRAIEHYKVKSKNEIRTLEDLKNLLSRYANDKEGNKEVAQFLWGYKLWTRVSLMRDFVTYLDSIGVTSQEALMKWAKDSRFECDFKGKVHGMGYAIYQWLVMRQGIETIKPDVHVKHFVQSILPHSYLAEDDLVATLEQIAKELGLKAYELDWRIWEYDKSTERKTA